MCALESWTQHFSNDHYFGNVSSLLTLMLRLLVTNYTRAVYLQEFRSLFRENGSGYQLASENPWMLH
jgi:hypothetical protein